jgi:hypothetical protein
MEQLWGIDLSEWWLPNQEGQPPMVRHIRNFITTKPVDEKGEDLRDMKGILMALSLSDTSSPESSQHSPAGQERPVLSRQSSSKAPSSSVQSDDPHFDFDTMAHVYGDSPEFVSNLVFIDHSGYGSSFNASPCSILLYSKFY